MLKDSSRQGIFQAITFWGMCALMCGAFLAFLIGSGWLLAFSNESREKTFLVPFLILFVAVLVWKKHCKKMHVLHTESRKHRTTNIVSSLIVSLFISMLFMLYIFLPWWLPGYTGGPLLP